MPEALELLVSRLERTAAELRSGELEPGHAAAVVDDLARIAPLERAILRVALLEMIHPDAAPADAPIPPEGAIDEAVELAKTYSGADAPGFVNGILSAVHREMGQNPATP